MGNRATRAAQEWAGSRHMTVARLPLAARQFVACAQRFSSAPLHELVESLKIDARSAGRKELGGSQRGKLFRHGSGGELVYARAASVVPNPRAAKQCRFPDYAELSRVAHRVFAR